MSTSERSRQERVAEQTEIRRRLLANGYSCFPCEGKNGQPVGWPGIVADERLIEEWSGQLRWVSTAVHVGPGRLVGLDVDIDDGPVLGDFIERIPDELWSRLKRAPVRRGGGAKEMWLVRLREGEEARRFKESTGKWGDPAGGEDDTDHKLEIWARPAKLLVLYGARTVEGRGEVVDEYSWVDGRGPCEVPVSELPEVGVEDFDVLLRCAVEAMQAAGWDRLDVAGVEDDAGAERVFDLVDGMRFVTRDHGEVGLEDLEALCQSHDEVRMYSWLPGRRRRSDRCSAKLNDYDGLLQIHDFDTGVTHRVAEADGAYTRQVVEAVRDSLGRLGEALGRQEGGRGEAGEEGRGLSRLEMLAASVPEESRLFGGSEDDVAGDGRPVLDVSGGELVVATVQAAGELAGTDYMFDLSGRLVGVLGGRVIEMSEPRLALEIAARFHCVRAEKHGKKVRMAKADPPAALIRQVLAYAPEAGFRPLRAIVDMPVLTADGRMVAEGYDPESLLVVSDTSGAGDRLPDAADMAVVRSALDVLWKPFSEFPFVGAGDRGGALACLLTAVARAWLPTAPMFAFDAPVQGSGKSLLCRAAGALGGRYLFSAPLPLKNEDEIRKRLMSVLLGGHSAVVYDNQIGLLDSASLAAVLTSETFSDRELGHNTRTLTAPTNVLVMVNGNNLMLGGDMPRRTVRVRIDPQTDTPFERQFDFDPEAWVRENRGEMVAAALVLLRWGMQAAGKGRIGSFERWDQVVGQTVARIGREVDDRFGDPVDVIRAAHEDDPRRDELSDLLTALRDEFGNKWFTGADVASRMAGASSGNPLLEAFGLDKSPGSKSIGRYLSFRRDARVNGVCIQVSKDPHKKVNRFRVWSDADSADVVVDGDLEQKRAALKARIAISGA